MLEVVASGRMADSNLQIGLKNKGSTKEYYYIKAVTVPIQ